MIDYKLIGKAQEYYEKLNYVYVEVPWIVPNAYVLATLPDGKRPFRVSSEYALCGSAEQGFLCAMDKNILEDYKLQAITPCFRDEDVETIWTRLYFMKLELIHINPLIESYDELIRDAEILLQSLGLDVHRVKTDIGCDLYYKEIELGSYGLREYKNNIYVYGTGLAEPRTSLCITTKK
jgi:seryl-tRNA synthetase